jgi:hypothetical protein
LPPRDPRLRPALERADPGDSGIFDGYRADDSPWRFTFGDGEEHPVTVRGWWLDKRGRQVVGIEWRIAGSTWNESYLVASEKMREV